MAKRHGRRNTKHSPDDQQLLYGTILFRLGATVQITNSANTVFDFFSGSGFTGEYVCTNFVPVINENYTLTVQYNGQTYSATNTLYATPEILYVEQETVTDVDGSDKSS